MLGFKSIYSISAASWLIFGLYLIMSVQRFIVRRYEKETKLSEMMFFNEYLIFTRHLPSFFRSSIYSCHLILFAWGWKIVQKIKEKQRIKYYDDIEAPEDVLRYFSKKEVRRVKLVVITLIIITAHVVGMDVLGCIWPGILD
jgi:hypothetical protein